MTIMAFLFFVFSSRTSIWKRKFFYWSGCFCRHLSEWCQADWGISPL